MIKAPLQNATIFIWVLLMMFTASTEFAPGQWLDVALSQIVGMRGILVLAYVSGLMFVMRMWVVYVALILARSVSWGA